jgi:glycosyltransferase involved in cell wall biosynthesis
VRFFAQHLAEFGWEPIVLTTRPEYYEWPVDPENEQLLPESLEVIRTSAVPARFTRKFGLGDLGMRTLWHHWQAIKGLCREGKPDLILIPVPPYVPMILGRLAKRKFGIPYVIDYIDPWVTDYYKDLPRKQRPPKWFFANALSRILEPFAIGKAGHITAVSKGITDGIVSRYSQLRSADVTEIPYGGETADFDFVRSHRRKNPIFDPEDGLFHFCYIGVCVPGMHSAIRAFFTAIRLKLEETPELAGRMRLHFVGTSYLSKTGFKNQITPLAEEAGIAQMVDEHPQRVSYLDSLQLMLDSHALAIFGYEEPHYAASKIYPSVLARRPILAILHEESSPAHILEEIGASELVTFGNDDPLSNKISEIGEKLCRILLLSEGFDPPTNWKAFEPYTTRAMTARLVSSFEKALLLNSTDRHNLALDIPLSESQQN